MTKIFIIICSCFLVLSCSTNSTKDVLVLEDESAKEKEAKIPHPKADENSGSKVSVVPGQPVASVMQQSELDRVIVEGDNEKIQKTSIELLQVNSKNYKALNSLAMCHYKKQQFEAAILLLNRALAVNPKSSEVYNNFGLIMFAKNEKKEAVNMFRKALQLNPENYLAAANLSSIYAKEKDYSKVIFSLEKFVKNGKANIFDLNNYAIALVATGKDKEAAEIYEEILKQSPEYKNAMLNYAILMIEKQDKYKEGLDLINRLKFVGADHEARQTIKDLEFKVKAGLK